MTHEEHDDGLPVLNAVVESGNESIIQSSRLGREVLHELDMLQQSNPVKFVLQDHILDKDEGEQGDAINHQESQLDPRMGLSEAINAQTTNSDDEIELMIDQVVDRHIHELRRDLRRLLIRAKQKP